MAQSRESISNLRSNNGRNSPYALFQFFTVSNRTDVLASRTKEPYLTACHGLNCSNTSLINAHILPRGFARLIRAEPEAELLKIAADGVRPASPQLGATDRNILCADCDSALGKYDDYAVRACKDFKPDYPNSDLFEMKSIDTEPFSKFILSFLWRASISASGRYCGVVTFGWLYEPLTRKIIFGSCPIGEIPALKLFLSKLRSDMHDVSRITTDPIRFRFEKLNAYSFLLGGFRVIAALDGQELAPHFDALIINRTKVFRGNYYEFDGSPEHLRLAEMVAADETQGLSKRTLKG
jgi:hypothetical protein